MDRLPQLAGVTSIEPLLAAIPTSTGSRLEALDPLDPDLRVPLDPLDRLDRLDRLEPDPEPEPEPELDPDPELDPELVLDTRDNSVVFEPFELPISSKY